ncbi:winged helix-turn-helix transcriptional regulator [Capsulimonas corticalis]|uniref:winged helix-turn-helix transcriptional regulator n=1 Tax=Capsulimonas corticalis TaxID=2219043 RepID=UPI000FFA0FD6|nr:helix-turn-helix domain-containing protein [Capsulimonas corticalis]
MTTESEECDLTDAFLRGALLLQEKWVMMIVHGLLDRPMGFSELMRKGNVNTTTLTQRLNLLEHAGLLTKTIHSTMPPRTSYELTESGQALRPILEAITKWSSVHLAPLADPGVCPGAEASSPCESSGC